MTDSLLCQKKQQLRKWRHSSLSPGQTRGASPLSQKPDDIRGKIVMGHNLQYKQGV